MKTLVKLPSGSKGYYPNGVNIDLEMTGDHHDKLLSGNSELYDRVIVSVLDSMMEEDAYKITMADMLYLFFMARAQSISPDYRTSWTCSADVVRGDVKVSCNTPNSYHLNINELKINYMQDTFEFPVYPFSIFGLDGNLIAETEVSIKLLSMDDEIQIIDSFLGKGISRKDLASKNAYDYARTRILHSLDFKDSKYNSLSLDERSISLKKNNLKTMNALLVGIKNLSDSIGIDLTPRDVQCKECKSQFKLALPIAPEFFLPNE